jgi:hypothetical protein
MNTDEKLIKKNGHEKGRDHLFHSTGWISGAPGSRFLGRGSGAPEITFGPAESRLRRARGWVGAPQIPPRLRALRVLQMYFAKGHPQCGG